jgi:3-hydroxyisobutyrate dehydrogenase-like beta-hydroxyacid dehydrogenase
MGSGMARCLLKAGHRLKVYNRSRDKAEKLAAGGAVVVDRPGDACRGDAVITMLADDGAVEGVTFLFLAKAISWPRSAKTPFTSR